MRREQESLLLNCLAGRNLAEQFVFLFHFLPVGCFELLFSKLFLLRWNNAAHVICFHLFEEKKNKIAQNVCKSFNLTRVFNFHKNVLIRMFALVWNKIFFLKVLISKGKEFCAGRINNMHGCEFFPCFFILLVLIVTFCEFDSYLWVGMDEDGWVRQIGSLFVNLFDKQWMILRKNGWIMVEKWNGHDKLRFLGRKKRRLHL